MSEHEPILDGGDETSVDALPLVQMERPVAADNDGTAALSPTSESSLPPTDWSVSETAAIHFPLVQMHQLAHAIEHGSDDEVRRMHGVFLDVFSAGRRNFLHFLQSLHIQAEITPTAAYVVGIDGEILPVADIVTEIADSPTRGDFLGLTADYDGSESPVFALTRVKSGADFSDDIPVFWDEGGSAKMEAQIAALDELAGLEELNTGDEVTARRLPPVELIPETKNSTDGLPDYSAFAELLTPTPPPGGVFTLTPGYSSFDQSTPRRDTRVLALTTVDGTPTPTNQPPQWVWNLFTLVKDRGGVQNVGIEDFEQLEGRTPRSAE